MGVFAWIVLGLLAGLIAKALYPGPQPGGLIATILLGIVGAVTGGWIGRAITGGTTQPGITFSGVMWAVLGSVVVLFIWGLVTGRKRAAPR